MSMSLFLTQLSAVLTLGTPLHGYFYDSTPDTTPSYCFEELCTNSTAQKPHGTFYSVVSRRIGELDIIMAGEVDCSTSMHSDQSVDNNLISISYRHGTQPEELR